MKKMIMMALVVGLCGMAQAAQFNWGMNSGQTLAPLAGGSIWFVYDVGGTAAGGTGFDAAGLASMTGFTLNTVLNGGDYAIRTGSGDVAGYFTENAWQFIPGGAIGDGNNYPTTGTKSFYAIVIASDGLTMAYSTVKRNNVTTSNVVAQTAKWNTLDFTTVTAVPEPTAMALLALGAAAIGLRRKFRK